MKTRYWISIPVVGVIIVVGVVLFIYGYLPRPFFSGGKYRAINQYEIFRDLLIIIVTLAGLSLVVFGASVYLALRGRIEEIAQREAKKTSDQAQTKVTRQLVRQFIKIAIVLAHQNWRTIKIRIPQKDQEVERKYLQDWSVHALKEVLAFAKDTLPVTQNKNFWEKVENKKYLINLKNNLAFYMACRKDSRDRKDARKYASEVEKETRSQSVPDYEYLDTVAWVLRQFALNDEDRNRSEALVQELTNRTDISDEEKKRLLDKYAEKPKDS